MPQHPHPLTSLSKTLPLLILLSLPPLTPAGIPTHPPSLPQTCHNISGSALLAWTAVNFTFNSTQVTPDSPPSSDSSGSGYIPPIGPNKGEVFFNLTNTAVDYVDSCSGRLDTTTYDSGWFICQDPNGRVDGPDHDDDTTKSSFRFNAVTGMLEINQTWGCKPSKETDDESVWFQATGSMNITEPCHIYYWANWTTGDVASPIHDCETQNLTIVPDSILEIGGAMAI